MASISNVSHDPNIVISQASDIEVIKNSRIFRKFQKDFPGVELPNNWKKLKEAICVQWIRYYLKRGFTEQIDPPFWDGLDKWYRETFPKIMAVILKQGLGPASFLGRSYPEQLGIFKRLDTLYVKFRQRDEGARRIMANVNLLPPEVITSLLDYIMAEKRRSAEIEEDANEMMKKLDNYLELAAKGDSKESC